MWTRKSSIRTKKADDRKRQKNKKSTNITKGYKRGTWTVKGTIQGSKWTGSETRDESKTVKQVYWITIRSATLKEHMEVSRERIRAADKETQRYIKSPDEMVNFISSMSEKAEEDEQQQS